LELLMFGRSSFQELGQPWKSTDASVRWPVVLELAHLANDVYSPREQAASSVRARGWSEVIPFAEGAMAGCWVGTSDRRLWVLVFQGTNGAEDWRVNFDVIREKHPLGMVHRGFWSAYQSLRRAMLAPLQTWNKPWFGFNRPQIWIAGHSLGGALATLATVDLTDDPRFRIQGTMTFGQPMLFNAAAAAQFDRRFSSSTIRVINGSDPVSRIPPTYRHCGEWLWFQDGLVERSIDRAKRRVGSGSATTAMASSAGPAAMTNDEFEVFRNGMLHEVALSERPADSRVVRGNVDLLAPEHSMLRYLERIQSQLARKCNA
jgi:pimeloyl-ACP methyl ester carboxylesterase